jgi:DNA-directed RNA polymerase specialized sigma24 family protein
MTSDWTPTPEAFDKLLRWLDPDREKAGEKYEDIRRRLIRFFTCRGCDIPEELADATINRVVKIIDTKSEGHTDDPIRLFLGVAKNIFREWVSRKPLDPKTFPPPPPHPDEQGLECLDACMEKLPPEERGLIIRYYEQGGREKIDGRHSIASELGVNMNTLRIQACRIRKALRNCVISCIKRKAA